MVLLCSDEGLTQVATACGRDARRDQRRVGHGGGGAFARAPGDGDGLAITELIQRACDFGGDGGAGRPCGLEIGVVPRLGNGGIGDDQLGMGKILLLVAPKSKAHLRSEGLPELGDGGLQGRFFGQVGHQHLPALRQQTLRARQATAEAAQSHDYCIHCHTPVSLN